MIMGKYKKKNKQGIIKKLFGKLWQTWFRLNRPIRFLLVGGFNNVGAYLLFLFLIHLMGQSHYQLALILQYALFSVVAFATQKIFVFAHGSSGLYHLLRQYVGALTTWVVGYAINALLLHLFVGQFSLPVYLAQFLAMLLVAIVNYHGLKILAFKKEKT